MSTTQIKRKAPKLPVEQQDVVHTTLKDAEVEITVNEDFQTDKEDVKTFSSNSNTSDFWENEHEEDYQDYLK